MVGSTGTLLTMRLVRSKLRKREESSSPVSMEAAQVQHSSTEQHNNNNNNNNNNHHQQQQQQQQQQTIATPIAYRQNPSSVWVFPPLPPQPNIFCTNSQVS